MGGSCNGLSNGKGCNSVSGMPVARGWSCCWSAGSVGTSRSSFFVLNGHMVVLLTKDL